MHSILCEGDVSYLPVRFESKLFALGVRFGFTAFSIALGSSYFQVIWDLIVVGLFYGTSDGCECALALLPSLLPWTPVTCGNRCALEKTSFNSHHQDQARATATSPPDPH
eukprot:1160247-Pelagomonas_calceolata.AAC.6